VSGAESHSSRARSSAQKDRRTLEEITKPQTIAELSIEIEKARADDAAKYAAFQKAKVTWMGLSW
jgi:hypothetical protein